MRITSTENWIDVFVSHVLFFCFAGKNWIDNICWIWISPSTKHVFYLPYSESWIVAGSWASKYYCFCNLINVVHNVVTLSLQFVNRSKYTTIDNWVNNSEVLLKILWFKLSNTISQNFLPHCEITMLFICLACLFFHLQVKFQGWFCSSWSMMLVGIWIFQFYHDS